MSDRQTVGAVVRVLHARLEQHAPGWVIASWPGDLFADAADIVSAGSHRAVTVHAASSAWSVPDQQRPAARRGLGSVQVTTTIDIRWRYGHALDDREATYLAALDAEDELRRAILTHTGDPLHLRVQAATRTLDREGWVLGSIRATVTHLIPLEA